jgi:hypothetical protein
MFERAKENFEFTRKKLEHAKSYFSEGDLAESVHYIWVVFENCINIVKDIKNNKPLHEHQRKIDLFKIYYSLGYLKKDYSETFAKLLKLRITADFGDYGNSPKIPEKKVVKEFLDDAISLFNEVEKLLLGLDKK